MCTYATPRVSRSSSRAAPAGASSRRTPRASARCSQGLEIELESGVVPRLEAHVWISVYPDEGNDPEILLENATSAWQEVGPHGGVRYFSHSETP